METYTVGLLLFNEVEVLDFAGPFEVLSVTDLPDNKDKPFNVVTISEKGELIQARNGLKVQPDYSFLNHPPLDIIIVPGGYGAREIEMHNPQVISWVQQQNQTADFVTSVCTGAFILAEAGLLKNLRATTHWTALDRLEESFPDVQVMRETKYVDEGRIITSAGISAGIEMALHLVEKLLGEQVAISTARQMEYDWKLNK